MSAPLLSKGSAAKTRLLRPRATLARSGARFALTRYYALAFGRAEVIFYPLTHGLRPGLHSAAPCGVGPWTLQGSRFFSTRIAPRKTTTAFCFIRFRDAFRQKH